MSGFRFWTAIATKKPDRSDMPTQAETRKKVSSDLIPNRDCFGPGIVPSFDPGHALKSDSAPTVGFDRGTFPNFGS
ncbi:hypothetical protein EVAR_5375_1 [Eumeta japonica]|uniref:Uncharacterized protein n=1 Tax=Eumeta variegata TaxID=151549 RepID=A0A4C1TNB6_EUMVA|nr:hypothetical protein EVAR_5375_1 [Eumeta japonica]